MMSFAADASIKNGVFICLSKLFVNGFSVSSLGKLDNGNLVGLASIICSAILAWILDMLSSLGTTLYLTLASATLSLSILCCPSIGSARKKAICFCCDSGIDSSPN